MNNVITQFIVVCVMLVRILQANAAYKETMNPDGLTKNLKDCDIVDDDGKTNQSDKFQEAIDEIAEQGGGRLQPLNPTPNIDRLARAGMRFDRCYVGNSICCPSRATLLTGKHSHANGILANSKNFNHEQQQFQRILQQVGYQTARHIV